MSMSQCQHSTTRKLQVLGLKFADVIHYKPKVTIFGFDYKYSREVTSDSIFDSPTVVLFDARSQRNPHECI